MNQRHLPFFAFLALALGLWAAMEYDPNPTVPLASHMPALTVQKLDSEEPMQWQAKPGQVTVLNFFASWCVPCLAEHPQMKKLSTLEGIEIVGIAWNDKPEALDAWLREHGNPFTTVLRDNSGRAALTAGLRGVPETFVIDKHGKVKLHIRGAIDPATGEKLHGLLQQWRDEEVTTDAPAS